MIFMNRGFPKKTKCSSILSLLSIVSEIEKAKTKHLLIYQITLITAEEERMRERQRERRKREREREREREITLNRNCNNIF